MQAAILIGALAAALALARILSRDRLIDRRIRRGPRLAVAGMPDGAITSLRGTARAAEPSLVAPLSRTPCIYYQLEVQAFDPSSVLWVTVHAESAGRAFHLDDGTGSALIEPGDWRISVEREALFAPVAAGTVRVILARRGIAWVCRRRLRARERVLCDGQPVAVLGRGVREPDPLQPPAGYRQAGLRPVLRSGRRLPLYITDHVDS